MQLGRERTDNRKHRRRLETGSDVVNLLALCLELGWRFPPVPVEEPLLAAQMDVVVTGRVVETFVRNPRTPAWVDRNGIEYTRYDCDTGDVTYEEAAA